MDIHDNPEIKAFLSTNISAIEKIELVKYYVPQFNEISQMLREMISVMNITVVPDIMVNRTITVIKYWNAIFNDIAQFEPISDRTNGNRIAGSIQSRWEQFYNHLTGFPNQDVSSLNHIIKDFFGLYGAIMTLKSKSVSEDSKAINDLLSKSIADLESIQQTKESIQTIHSETQRIASERTFTQYASIFAEESSKLSSFSFTKVDRLYRWKIKIGVSEYWLGFAITLVLTFLLAIIFEWLYKLFPLKGTSTEMIIGGVTRILAVSIWIYLITFSFKQFSINKHLATVNKHRSNALNSYKLFTESIDRADTSSRNALMLQVAKAIYEQGNTGHLASRNQDSTSIIEMTKILGHSDKASV